MIGFLSIIAVLFLIGVFFYKRSQEEIRILQVEAENIDRLGALLGELDPVVAHGFKEPPVWKPEEIQKGRLGPLVAAGAAATMSKKLAEESGLRVWIEHSIVPKLVHGNPIEYISWSDCYARIGSQGLWKTAAYTTVLLPSSSQLIVTLMANKNEPFLPAAGSWKGKDPNTFTKADGPLIGSLQMVDVIVRTGSFLCVPPHWFVSVKAADNANTYWSQIEIHHPISWLQANAIEGFGGKNGGAE